MKYDVRVISKHFLKEEKDNRIIYNLKIDDWLINPIFFRAKISIKTTICELIYDTIYDELAQKFIIDFKTNEQQKFLEDTLKEDAKFIDHQVSSYVELSFYSTSAKAMAKRRMSKYLEKYKYEQLQKAKELLSLLEEKSLDLSDAIEHFSN